MFELYFVVVCGEAAVEDGVRRGDDAEDDVETLENSKNEYYFKIFLWEITLPVHTAGAPV